MNAGRRDPRTESVNGRQWGGGHFVAVAIVALPTCAAILAFAGGLGGAVQLGLSMAAAGLAATASMYLIERTGGAGDDRPLSGLADRIDQHVDGRGLDRPLAAIIIELRGIAADTVVDGAPAWTEPVAVISRRLTEADLGVPADIARLGPHSFGLVVSVPTRSDALAIAETLVGICRVPMATPERQIRIDAVAGVSHAEAGSRVRGEELLRLADASMRVDSSSAAPVSTAGSRLVRHARRVVEVETEIRHSLDVDLLTARLAPVVNVHTDEVVGLRSGYDWTAVSSTEPEMLRSIAGSLGLRRSLETQYLMRSISAAEMLPGSMTRPIVARIDADRVTDERAVSQLGLLIRASGIDPSHLILELDGWGADTLGEDAHAALRDLGVGVGVALRHHGSWEPVPAHFVGRLDSVSVSACELMEDDEVSALRVSRLARVVDGDFSKVTVVDVDSASIALELSAAGLPVQCGRVHGHPLSARELGSWMSTRQHL